MSRAPATRPDLAKTNVALVGSALRVAEVEPSLSQLDATLRHHDWSDDIAQTVDDGTVAVLVTEDPPTGPLWRSVRTLRQIVPSAVAVVVLVPDGTSAPEIKRLYEAGAAVALEWPADSDVITRVLVDVLAVRYVQGPATEADKALGRVLKA